MLAVDVAQMRRAGPGRPRIYELIENKKLRYSPDDPEEEWKSYDQVLNEIRDRGVCYADCEDFATLAAAELVADDLDPAARPVIYKSADHLFHVVTYSPRYGYLDACIPGGMGGEAQ
jgi:hypothetical protein